ncbi:hypothetical protein [Ferrimicrobium sp.]|uniref:hypothetical protein n=1 Tax=Ferrimicrobium sp. TaxID=2926050 RepID=UPI0026305E4C|nr:hypothetical protein [Ferrimicrobium sp.]
MSTRSKDEFASAYETLRARVTEVGFSGAPLGLSLLLNQGISTWMRTLPVTGLELPSLGPVANGDREMRGNLELVHVLAAMALANNCHLEAS